jgi:hypothetical protein
MRQLAEHPEKIQDIPSYQRMKEAYDHSEDMLFY